MSVARVDAMTLAAFLEWEERQETKYEFDGFEPVAMVGVSWEHSTIQANIMGILFDRLRGKPCRPHGTDLKIEVAGRIRHPDAFVVCNPVIPGTTVITDPVVIFEILSEGSEHRDRVTKNEEYRLTPSVQHYVILEQYEVGGVVFAREGDRWVGTLLTGAATLSMPEIGVEIPVAELYGGLSFPLEVQPAV
jgi:Uma2 family endonuclease